MMGHVEYIRFALHVAAGEYVPWEVSPQHEGLRTMAVRFRCLQCRKDPCGDRGEHAFHTKGKKFAARAAGIAKPDLASVVDFVDRYLDQLEGCVKSTFAEDSWDPRVTMLKFF